MWPQNGRILEFYSHVRNFLFRSDDRHDESQTEGTYLFLYKPNLGNHQSFVKFLILYVFEGKNIIQPIKYKIP